MKLRFCCRQLLERHTTRSSTVPATQRLVDTSRRLAESAVLGVLLFALAAACHPPEPTPKRESSAPSSSSPAPSGFGQEIDEILASADTFEVLSIDPWTVAMHRNQSAAAALSSASAATASAKVEEFHQHPVLGRKAVTSDAERKRVVAVMTSALNPEGPIAACFNPRHAIHATKGARTVDMLICFECLQAEVYLDGIRRDYVIRDVGAAFDNEL